MRANIEQRSLPHLNEHIRVSEILRATVYMTSLVSSGTTVNGIASLFKLLIGNHSFQFRVVDSPKTAENSLGATWWTLLFICTTTYQNFPQAPILYYEYSIASY